MGESSQRGAGVRVGGVGEGGGGGTQEVPSGNKVTCFKTFQ